MSFIDNRFFQKSQTNDLTVQFTLAQDTAGNYVLIEDKDGALPAALSAVALDGVYTVQLDMKYKRFDETGPFTFTTDNTSRLEDSTVGTASIVAGSPDKVKFQITDNETQQEGQYIGTIKLLNIANPDLSIDFMRITALVFEDDYTERIPVNRFEIMDRLGLELADLDDRLLRYVNRAIKKGVSAAYTTMSGDAVRWFRDNGWSENAIIQTEELCSLYLKEILYPEPSPEEIREQINYQIGLVQNITADADNDGRQDQGQGSTFEVIQGSR